MRVRGTGLLWLPVAAGPALVAWSLLGDHVTASFDVTNVYPNVVFGVLLPLLGALIVRRLPRNAIGWLFLGCGLASAVTLAVYQYAWSGLVDHPGTLPFALAAGWLSSWVWSLGFAPLVTLGVLLFPDGRLPGPRWRALAWLDAAAVTLLVLGNAFLPGPLQNHPVRDNPLGLPLPHWVFALLGGGGFGLLLVGMVGSGAAAVVRWRRAEDAERSQLSWFAFAVVLLVVAVVGPVPAPIDTALGLVAVPLLPLAVAVAILRDNLFGIEVVVRRSLVYAALTVVLLVAYGASVTLLGALLGGRSDPLAAVGATALVAVAFAPARSRLQRATDRLLYGDRGNPYAVISGLGRRLDVTGLSADGVDHGALAEVAETVATSLRLPYVAVQVGRAGSAEGPMVAEWGRPTPGVHTVPLSFRGDRVGTLLAAPRTPRDPFGVPELGLLEDLGRQIGVAAHAMLLGRALQHSRQELVTAREEERRRIRRDLHDGLGPTLAGVALGLDAVRRLTGERPEEAARLASELKQEVQAGLGDVRRLVEDLRPPALDQLGLLAALRQHAGRLSERGTGLQVSVESTPLPPLPAAVEVAAYRIVSEALNNVSRHASARHCRVLLTADEETSLRIEVVDDGVGLRAPAGSGLGLPAMRERATELGGSYEAGALAEGGTRIAARIPLVAS